jgi:hypothetical protein
MRKLSIVIILILIFTSSFGQVRSSKRERPTWVFSMGPTVAMFDGKLFTPTGFGAVFEPRFIFGNMGRNASASLDLPITLMSFTQKYGTDSIVNQGFSGNLPIVLDFNFFHGAYKRPDKHIGPYFGFGWNFNYLSFSTAREDKEDPSRDVKTNYEGLNHGLYVNGGFRIGIRSGVSFDIRTYAFIRFKSPEMSMYGVALLYNFGMKKKSYGQGSGWY